MRISDWSSDVCSSDLLRAPYRAQYQPASWRARFPSSDDRLAGGSMIPEPHFTPTVPGLIGHFAAQHGEAEALVRDGLRVTFTELDRRSAAVARPLIGRGAGQGARSAILAPPSPDRSEELRVGKEGVGTGKYRGSAEH